MGLRLLPLLLALGGCASLETPPEPTAAVNPRDADLKKKLREGVSWTEQQEMLDDLAEAMQNNRLHARNTSSR